MKNHHHIFRRAVHIFGLQATTVYYLIPDNVFISQFDKNYAMLICLICVIEFEYIRITKNWQIPGFRPYERYRFSALLWAALGLFICYLMCPYYIGAPLVLCAAWVDPLMGELRARNFHNPNIVGFASYFMILLISLLYLAPLPLNKILVISGVGSTVGTVCEAKKNYYLDDNFLMLVCPAVTIMFLLKFLP
ncbi:MAG: hypothetical protein ACPL1Y_03520 [Thermoplasmata archaeon]